VKSSCLKTNGSADIGYLGLACLTAQISGTVDVTGTLTLGDGKFTDKTVTKGSDTWALDASCLNLSGTKVTCEGVSGVFAATLSSYGYSDFTCVNAASGGGCTCQGTINSTGGPGGLGLLYNSLTSTGKYTTASNTLTVGDDAVAFSYCVNGNQMTVTPKPSSSTSTPYTGTVVLDGGGTGGAGGSGSGGSATTGGATSAGGKQGSGGSTVSGSGGAVGGNTAKGGTTGTGGTAGGTTASGGAAGGGTGGTAGGTTALGGTSGTTGGTTGSGGTTTTSTGGDGPCDLYQAANMPCAAAYSMVRVLSKSYKGPLFQVRAGSSSTNNTMSGGTTKDIMPGADGFADSATVDAACGGTGYCTVSVLYDHSGNGNDLKRAQKGNTAGGTTGALDDYESIATKGQVTAGGHKVYSLYMNRTEGYRSAAAGKNMPVGNKPQGTYELADGTRKGAACCWDFGNVTYLPATEWHFMDTLCLGHTYWGNSGDAQWFGFAADFEGGVWAGGAKVGDPGWGGLNDAHPTNTANPTMSAVKFALGLLRVNTTTWALHVADISSASALTKAWDGGIGVGVDHRGGIVLGVGGDNSNNSQGTFYEGAIVAGFPTDDLETSIFKNIKDVGYAAP
jgi:hypothetical protein